MDIDVTTSSDAGGRHVLDVAGAIDVQSRTVLLTEGRAALAEGATGLVVDLADVTFIDSTGIGALVELSHDAADAGATFTLRDPSPRAVRILDMTGLATVWPIESRA